MIIKQPYKGLDTFQEEDQDIFYGRAKQTELITDHLSVFRLTIVHGASGVGKSSILRAGVAARLRQEAKYNLREYNAPLIAVVVFPPLYHSWQGDLGVQLKQQIAADIQEIAPNIQAPTLKLPFIETLQEWTKKLGEGKDDGKLLIILDQFEDFLSSYSQKEEEQSYTDTFAQAVNCYDLRVNFLLSIRSNAFTQLDRFKSKIPNLMDKRIELKRLDRASAEEAIRKPLEIYNEQSPEQKIEIEEDLVKAVLNQITAQQEGGMETPYLQLVMKRLWDEEREHGSLRMQKQTFSNLGEARGIVEKHFKQQVKELTREGNGQIVSSLFKYLVTPSGTQIAQKADDLTLYINDDLPPDQDQLQIEFVRKLLEGLSRGSSRILRACESDRYEIYFGILADIVNDWLKTLRQLKHIALRAEEAWQDFSFSQLEALKTAIKAGDALKEITNKDQDWLTYSDTIPIIRTLQVILENIREQRNFEHPNSPIYGASIRPNGTLLATASFDGTVCIWDLEKSHEEPPLNKFQDPSETVYNIAFSQDGRQLATASWDGTVVLWDLQGNQLRRLGQSGEQAISTMSFSPDGQQLAAASLDGAVHLWDLQESSSQHQQTKPPVDPSSFVTQLIFVRQGRQLAITCSNGTVFLWDWATDKRSQLGEAQSQLKQPQLQVGEAQSELLASASQDGFVRIWNLANPSQKQTKQFFHKAYISYVSYDTTTRELDTVSWDGKVRRLNLKDEKWSEFSCNRSPVYRASFSSDRQQLVTVASDGAAHLWSLTDDFSTRLGSKLSVCQTEPTITTTCYCVSFGPDGKLATAYDKKVRFWNSHGEEIPESFSFASTVLRVSYSPDGRYLGIALQDNQGKACLVGLDGRNIIEYQGHTKTVYCVSISPDNHLVASASGDGTVHIWDLEGNRLQAPLSPEKGTIYYVSFSPDAQKLAMACVDGTVCLWDLQGEKKVQCVGHANVVYCLSFSPDGKLLATASGDGTARLWDLEGNQKGSPFRHESTVFSVCFSHDGELLATACGDGKTCLWQVKDRQKIAEFQHHERPVYSVCFSPDGQQVATASADHTVKLRMIENLEELLERGRNWPK